MVDYEHRSSGIHGTGIFAKNDIKKGTKIVEYLGEKVTKEEGTHREQAQLKKAKHGAGQVYVFELDDEWDIDGDVEYNDARFINNSCDPNCKVIIKEGHIWIVTKRDIKAGEELSYDYGFDDEDYKDFPCKCGAKNCFGFMVGEEYRRKIVK